MRFANPPFSLLKFGGHEAASLPETNSSHLKVGHPERKFIIQPPIFRCYVSYVSVRVDFENQHFIRVVTSRIGHSEQKIKHPTNVSIEHFVCFADLSVFGTLAFLCYYLKVKLTPIRS